MGWITKQHAITVVWRLALLPPKIPKHSTPLYAIHMFHYKVYTFSFKDPKNLVSCDVAYLCHTMWVTQDHTYLKNRSPNQVLSSITPLISCIKIARLVLYWPIWEGVKPFLASLYICSLTSSAVNLSHWYKNHNKRYTLNQHKWYS